MATLGPSSWDEGVIKAILEAGVDVFRINTAHGSPEDHRALIRRVHSLGAAILLDTQGPKVRLGLLPEPLAVQPGQEVVFGNEGIPVSHPSILSSVPLGSRILLADGTLEFQVVGKEGGGLRCQALRSGIVQGGKGLNFPGVSLSLPALTDQDRLSLELAREGGVDYVAISFVQRPGDIEEARAILGENGPRILAKVELAEAVRRMEELVLAADGAMVARGDLGVEIDPFQVPLVQRRLVDLCNAQAKPVIVATQMLLSMVSSSFPTRAEVADIANAVWDGADALMLSEETTVGRYPVEAVRTMAAAAQAAEAGEVAIRVTGLAPALVGEVPAAIAQAACHIAQEIGATAILCATFSGWTARLVASFRPRIPIVATTPVEATARRLALVWGVIPLRIKRQDTPEALAAAAVASAQEEGLVSPGERVVFTAGLPFSQPGTTNLLRVIEV